MGKLNMNEKQVLMLMLHNGYDVQYNRLSLNNVDKFMKKKKFQVHNNESNGHSEVYEKLEVAVDQFLELKGKLRNVKR